MPIVIFCEFLHTSFVAKLNVLLKGERLLVKQSVYLNAMLRII